MGQLVDLYTVGNMHTILSHWYGPEAKNWQINDELILFVAQIILDNKNSAQFFNLLPRYSGSTGVAKSITTIAMQGIKSIIKNLADDKHAIASLKIIALYKYQEIQMIKDGI